MLHTAPRCLVLGLPGGQERLLFIDTTAVTENGFTLNRPAPDPVLWQALFRALQHTGRVLVVPDGLAIRLGVENA